MPLRSIQLIHKLSVVTLQLTRNVNRLHFQICGFTRGFKYVCLCSRCFVEMPFWTLFFGGQVIKLNFINERKQLIEPVDIDRLMEMHVVKIDLFLER